MDAGVSGGPGGARRGASVMVGGREEDFERLEDLFAAIAAPAAYQFFEGYGAGHFVKMVHNGIEYGMMQALAEGFTILKKSEYQLDLSKVAEIYNNGSVIESRLVGWLQSGLKVFGEDLKGVSGSVGHTGEGEWTVKTAEAMKIKADIIAAALEFRKKSASSPSYTGQVLSALRNQFGGHSLT
jgi:6-phosphogluconate dehydrogenase